MLISGRLSVGQITPSKDGGRMWYTMYDNSTGGRFSISVPGKFDGIKPGDVVDVDGEVRIERMPKFTLIEWLQGTVVPILLKEGK